MNVKKGNEIRKQNRNIGFLSHAFLFFLPIIHLNPGRAIVLIKVLIKFWDASNDGVVQRWKKHSESENRFRIRKFDRISSMKGIWFTKVVETVNTCQLSNGTGNGNWWTPGLRAAECHHHFGLNWFVIYVKRGKNNYKKTQFRETLSLVLIWFSGGGKGGKYEKRRDFSGKLLQTTIHSSQTENQNKEVIKPKEKCRAPIINLINIAEHFWISIRRVLLQWNPYIDLITLPGFSNVWELFWLISLSENRKNGFNHSVFDPFDVNNFVNFSFLVLTSCYSMKTSNLHQPYRPKKWMIF